MSSQNTAAAVPLDPAAAARLADTGLEYRTPSSDEDIDAWSGAVGRGFLGERSTPEQQQGWRENLRGDNRLVGVYDPAGAAPQTPVATVNSWLMDLTVDLDSFLPMWSISAVTVSATHRRRGIARALLEGELRAAVDAGIPIAGLTVSEATIYGRYGFGSAAHTGTWKIDARRAGWVGPVPSGGRLDHVEREDVARDLATLNETTRGQRPGDVSGWPQLWNELAGLSSGKPDPKTRGVRYTDADGTVRGILVYSFEGNAEDFTRTTMQISTLIADGPEAYAALWRYALQHDLVGTIHTSLRSLHEPLRWMVADERALAVTERDHHWLRILDVERCLRARRLRVPGSVTLSVTDALGFAEGDWHVQVDAPGTPVVSKVDGGAVEGPRVALGVAELSALLLGGVTASTLLTAGRIETDVDTARWLDLALAPATAPQLSYWY